MNCHFYNKYIQKKVCCVSHFVQNLQFFEKNSINIKTEFRNMRRFKILSINDFNSISAYKRQRETL